MNALAPKCRLTLEPGNGSHDRQLDKIRMLRRVVLINGGRAGSAGNTFVVTM